MTGTYYSSWTDVKSEYLALRDDRDALRVRVSELEAELAGLREGTYERYTFNRIYGKSE